MKKRLTAALLALALLLPALPVLAAEETPAALCVAAAGDISPLSGEEFKLLCRRATEHELESVTFDALSGQVGDLWYRRGEATGSRVSSATPYYPDKAPKISDITFQPSGRVTGETRLGFTLRSVKGEQVRGTLLLTVLAPAADLAITAAQAAPMDVAALSSLCREKTGDALRLLNFDLPNGGTLTYAKAADDIVDVAHNMVFYVDAGEGRALARVSYAPDRYAPYTYFTFAGVSAGGESFSARVKVTNPAGQTGRPYQAALTGEPVSLGLFPDLTAVTLALPSGAQGELWYDYGGYNARKIHAGESLSAADLSRTSFVPNPRLRGVVQLDYTGTTRQGKLREGVLALSCSKFDDLTGWNWAADAAEYLGLHGAAPDEWAAGAFRPGEQATRMEVIYAIMTAGYPGGVTTQAADFADLPAQANLANAVSLAAQKGIVLGNGGGSFDPQNPVTRQDALVLLYRALRDKGRRLAPAKELDFADAGQLADYAREAAGVLYAVGILQGSDRGTLDPRSPITRAEMAALVYRAFGQ